MTFIQPGMISSVDRLAGLLSETHNYHAPIGWEKYRPLALMLIEKFPIRQFVMDARFEDPTFKPGKEADTAEVQETTNGPAVIKVDGRGQDMSGEMADRVVRLLEEYDDRVPLALVLGVLEIVKDHLLKD